MGVVEDTQRTGIDVIDVSFLEIEKDGLALIDEDLGNCLVHYDRTFDQVFGEFLDGDWLVYLSFGGFDGCGHFVGFDLTKTVLTSHVSTEADQISDLFLEIASFSRIVFFTHLTDQLNSCITVLFPQLLANPLTVIEFFPHFLGKFLHEPFLQADQLIFQRLVALFSHITSNHQFFDHVILGLEVFKTDGFQLVQYFVVFLGETDLFLHGVCSAFAEDFAFRIASKRTSDWQIRLGVLSNHIANYFMDLEICLCCFFENLITYLDIMIAHLSICDKYDVCMFLFYCFLRNKLGWGTSFSPTRGNPLLITFFGGRSDRGVPDVVVWDVFGILVEDVTNCRPVIATTSCGTWVVNKDGVLGLCVH